MTKRSTAGHGVALLVAVAGLAYLSVAAGPTGRAQPKADPEFTEVREIDLSAIYSTSSQKKLERIYGHLAEDSPEQRALEAVDDTCRKRRSAPAVAVVRGDGIKQAVLATARLLQMKESPQEPVGTDEKTVSKKLWLFAYIAHTGSTPPQWLIYPPTVVGTKVRFAYTRFDGWFTLEPGEGSEVTTDHHAYLYWVPLGTFDKPDQVKAELVELAKTVKATFPAKAAKK